MLVPRLARLFFRKKILEIEEAVHSTNHEIAPLSPPLRPPHHLHWHKLPATRQRSQPHRPSIPRRLHQASGCSRRSPRQSLHPQRRPIHARLRRRAYSSDWQNGQGHFRRKCSVPRTRIYGWQRRLCPKFPVTHHQRRSILLR